MKYIIYCICLLLFVQCKEAVPTATQEEAEVARFRESYRPQYHFTPPEKWMNDPNGLVFYKDTYHLFYQYYPDDIVWGPMHWGHATSNDMISWEHQPIALYPDSLGYIFSGSAVIDSNNTSGLGTKDNPPMVAIFTYHLMEGESAGRTDFQTQGIAYSLDAGQTWTKYEGNPVIANDTGIKDFRDPKVMWHEDSQLWIMTLVAGDHAKFYSSADLKTWKYLSDFGRDQGAHGGVWECPDLFPLPVTDTGVEKWVLLISINPGAPNGGSGTQYFIGEFDGTTFTTDQTDTKWLDYGTDNYAGVTYNGLPDEERIFIGWMSNWNYARDTPTEVWRSAMTLPRKLSLHQNGDYYLKSKPLPTIDDYLEGLVVFDSLNTNDSIEFPDFNQRRISFEMARPLQNFSITFHNEAGDEFAIGFDQKKDSFYMDRTRSGKVDFQPQFAENVHYAPKILDTDDVVTFDLFLDASSAEWFIDDGATVITDQLFPNTPYNLALFESDAYFAKMKIYKVSSIWE